MTLSNDSGSKKMLSPFTDDLSHKLRLDERPFFRYLALSL